MNVSEVAQQFFEYTDEKDFKWLTLSQTQRYLRQAYDEFRRTVANYDPNVFSANATLTLTNARTYDLAGVGNPVRLLGATPTQAPMQRLTKIVTMDPSTPNRIKWVWYGVKTEEELGSDPYASPVYLLQGTTIYFGTPITDTLRVIYVPQGSKPRNPTGVDWSKVAVSDNEFIDDLDEFHDLIALFAYQQYAVRDNADNNQQLRLMDRRIQQLQQYLFNGRDSNAANHSAHTY